MMTVRVVSDPAQVPVAPVEGRPTFCYWNIVGLANPCRLLLALAGADCVDVRIDPGDKNDPNRYKRTWLDAKAARLAPAMALPNLPYYLEAGLEPFSQSDAILRYLARKHGVTGVPGREHIVDMCLDELKDYEGQLVGLSYVQGLDAAAAWLRDGVPPLLAKWSRLLGDQPFLTGDRVSAADLKLFVFLNKLRVLEDRTQTTVSNLGDWAGFMARVENLPRLKEYLASSDYMAGPLNNPHAKIN